MKNLLVCLAFLSIPFTGFSITCDEIGTNKVASDLQDFGRKIANLDEDEEFKTIAINTTLDESDYSHLMASVAINKNEKQVSWIEYHPAQIFALSNQVEDEIRKIVKVTKQNKEGHRNIWYTCQFKGRVLPVEKSNLDSRITSRYLSFLGLMGIYELKNCSAQ